MNSPMQRPLAPAAQPALELISLARLSPDLARHNLRALLLADPHHFGNITANSLKAVLNIQRDTTFESLARVGYDPQLEQLYATLYIKQSRGYSCNVSARGSEEYVRFYVTCDGGATWQDQGLRTVRVFDMPGQKPLEYPVTLQINPTNEFFPVENLARVRAILSWNSPPPAGTPHWTPLWGNVVDTEIEVDDFERNTLTPLRTEAQARLLALCCSSISDGAFVSMIAARDRGSVAARLALQECN